VFMTMAASAASTTTKAPAPRFTPQS
jgi:hypothetical protein